MVRNIKCFDLFSDLRLDSSPTYVLAQVGGRTTTGDEYGGFFYYDPDNVDTDDNINIIRPTGFSSGAWVRTTATIPAMKYYDSSGLIPEPLKKWVDVVTPDTGNGYSIDISSAGFSSIIDGGISIIAIKNSSTNTSVPMVSIKSKSTTAIVVNIIEGNPATVSILGNTVTLGGPVVFADCTGLTLEVMVIGN